MTFSGKR